MRIQPFQAVYPNVDYITSAETFFGRVKYEYPQYKKDGFFKKNKQLALYIYRIEKPHRHYTGLIACSDVKDYLDGKIKKHEKTLSSKEQQQMQLMVRRNAIVKPVLLIYPKVDEIQELTDQVIREKEVFYKMIFEKEQQVHSFWEISDQSIIKRFQNLFTENVPISYIADGHHRSSTTALMHQRLDSKQEEDYYDRMLSAYFPASELEIYDFNRIVECLRNQSIATFMARMSQVFDIEILDGPQKPAKKFEIVMYINREWFRLLWKGEVLEKYIKRRVILDADLLDEEVLKSIVGITDIRSDNRIKYIDGTKGVDGLVSRAIKNDYLVGFLLYPVEVNELISVADQEMTMPPKSTFFEPRIKNGLIVQEFK